VVETHGQNISAKKMENGGQSFIQCLKTVFVADWPVAKAQRQRLLWGSSWVCSLSLILQALVWCCSWADPIFPLFGEGESPGLAVDRW